MIKRLAILLLLTGMCLGTVTTTTTRVSFTGDGSTTTFSFSFPIVATSDLVVVQRTVSDGSEVTLTLTTNYSVTSTNANNDFSSGGTVTTVDTLTSASELLILRDAPDTQNADFDDSGVLRLNELEAAIDRSTLLIQQLQEEVARCIKAPKSDDVALDMTLDNSTIRANQGLGFTGTGAPTTSSGIITPGTVTVTAFAETILDDATASEARTTLGVSAAASAFMETVLDDTTEKAARVTLGTIDEFNVTDAIYGAIPDDSIDDTEEFQAALDAAALNGPLGSGTVYVPTGTYNFTGELTIDSAGITLTGSTRHGQDTHLIYSGTGTFITINNAFCKVQNLRIVGPNAAAAADPSITSDVGILVGASGDPKRNVILQDCLIRDWNVGINVGGSHGMVRDCDILDASNYGVWYTAGVSNKMFNVYVVVENAGTCVQLAQTGKMWSANVCTFSSGVGSTTTVGIRAMAINAVTITNCHFEDFAGVDEYDLFSSDPSSSITMIGNRSDGTIRMAAGDITLIGNFFDITTSQMDDTAGSRWTMTNNRNLHDGHFITGGSLPGGRDWTDADIVMYENEQVFHENEPVYIGRL